MENQIPSPENPEIPKGNPEEIKEIPQTPGNTSTFLEQVLQSQTISKGEETVAPINATQDGVGAPIPPSQTPQAQKPRDPVTAGTVLKFIGSILLVSIIFFGSFLAYIVFNPDQAAFFVNIFGIDPADIQNLLKNLINGSFGTIVLVLSILWIISLFRAIWVPKEQKRKRIMGMFIAGLTGVFLFSILGFWAYLYSIINATDYTNPGGNITIYDNSLYANPLGEKYARLYTTKNLIGPITLKYNISDNAKTLEKKNLITITEFKLDFDGAKCINNNSIITGTDPKNETGIICTFDTVRNYRITGSYIGKDRLGETQTIPINIEPVEIKGLIDIRETTNRLGKNIITFDASKIKSLGTPTWIYPDNSIIKESIITETLEDQEKLLCLQIMETSGCDRYFIIGKTQLTADMTGSILLNQSTNNPLTVSLSLSGISEKLTQEILSIDWQESDGTKLCAAKEMYCEYTFLNYGTKNISADITFSSNAKLRLMGTITLDEPIALTEHVTLKDENGMVLNTQDTYDPSKKAYIISAIPVPSKISLDARDVRTESHTVSNVGWKISDGTEVIEKTGTEVFVDVIKTKRYTIEALYTLTKTNGETRIAKDTIVLDLEKKNLQAVLNIANKTSDYVPVEVTVDASSSYSQNGEIKKFIFDFGEGRPETIGDAIQTYAYTTAGEKAITLTVIDDKNEKSTITKYIVLKDTPKTIGFSTSMSPGAVGIPVDFLADKSTGQIEEWIWNFGDNSSVSRGYEVSHTFEKPGTYTVELTLRYADGTLKKTNQSFEVKNSIE